MSIAEIPNPALYTDLYQLTMGQGYFKSGYHQKTAHFDFFFRKAPFSGEYVVFAGLADLLSVLESYRFTDDEREWLRQNGFEAEFCDFLAGYRFDGSIISAREGDVVFPGEPILTVSGSLLSCQLVETLVLNLLNFQSLIATKARRIRLAAGDCKLVEFGLRRGHASGSIAASRAAAVGGIDATSNVLAGRRYNLPVSGTMAHSWIQCFDNELEAFRTYARMYPDTTILLVDTYDTVGSGLPHAITVARELEDAGHRLAGIRLDSGNPLTLSRKARAMLDEAGLDYVSIIVSDQLDENRIADLKEKNAPIDFFGIGTRLITGHPDGALGGVYKICSLDGRPSMKYTDESSKRSLPGIKEIDRETDADVSFLRDIIRLADHPPSGVHTEQIRTEVMKSGRILDHQTDVKKIATFSASRFAQLPDHIKRLSHPQRYDVSLDNKLKSLIEQLKY